MNDNTIVDKTYQGDWFTLEEREPKTRQRCLVWGAYGDECYIGIWNLKNHWFVGEFAGLSNILPRAEVVAWQPIPEKPMTTDEYLRHHGYDPDAIARETVELVERVSNQRIYGEVVQALVQGDEGTVRKWLASLSDDDLADLAKAADLLDIICWDMYSSRIESS